MTVAIIYRHDAATEWRHVVVPWHAGAYNATRWHIVNCPVVNFFVVTSHLLINAKMAVKLDVNFLISLVDACSLGQGIGILVGYIFKHMDGKLVAEFFFHLSMINWRLHMWHVCSGGGYTLCNLRWQILNCSVYRGFYFNPGQSSVWSLNSCSKFRMNQYIGSIICMFVKLTRETGLDL